MIFRNGVKSSSSLFAVHAIVDRNKADVVIGEKGIRIVTHLQIVPAEPGHILYDYHSNITGLNVLNHLLKAGTVEVCTCITIIHIEFGIRKMMVFGIFGKQLFLRRDLSRSVFAKECAIRIDKQQKERYNNVVIDNDVII